MKDLRVFSQFHTVVCDVRYDLLVGWCTQSPDLKIFNDKFAHPPRNIYCEVFDWPLQFYHILWVITVHVVFSVSPQKEVKGTSWLLIILLRTKVLTAYFGTNQSPFKERGVLSCDSWALGPLGLTIWPKIPFNLNIEYNKNFLPQDNLVRLVTICTT